jgi:ATP-dependent DNA ligase
MNVEVQVASRTDLKLTCPARAAADSKASAPKTWSSSAGCKPRVIVEVAFVEWTESGLVRHTTFVGINKDKAVS